MGWGNVGQIGTMVFMERVLESESVEGEIGLVIEYQPGVSYAVDVLQGAMGLIQSLDRLDNVLLSSIDTSLEPVSILNDVQHSSLKILLARALRKIPDDHLGSLEWKKWVGGLLVKGKHVLLQKLDADAPEIYQAVASLTVDYRSAPGLVGYEPPNTSAVQDALDGVSKARALFPRQVVRIQTELGDVLLAESFTPPELPINVESLTSVVNKGHEFFKIKSVDMLGQSQWTVLRNGRSVKVDILHRSWLEAYQQRAMPLLPGDSLECAFEETVVYDGNQNEIERKLAIIEVLSVVSPPFQNRLI